MSLKVVGPVVTGSLVIVIFMVYAVITLKSQVVSVSSITVEQKIDELVDQLKIESLRGVEYFNSQAFDSLVAISDTSSVDRIKRRITEPNRAYLLPLLSLRQIDSVSYDQVDSVRKISILVDALNQAKFFNSWGVPHRYRNQTPQQREAPAQAIIEMGDFAKTYLRPLFQEKRSAPVWGSSEIYDDYNYRVLDFARALSMAIDGDTTELLKTRAERDSIYRTIVP